MRKSKDILITDDENKVHLLEMKEVAGVKLWKDKLVWMHVWIIEVYMREDHKAIMTTEYTFHTEEKAQQYFKLIYENMEDKDKCLTTYN